MSMTQKTYSILIADDDGTTRHVLRLLLREHGHLVVGEAANGEKAVEMCEILQPDIIFLDIDMPRMNGHQAADRIRLAAPGVRVIMVSALATMGNVQTALQAGAGGFVVKPFNAVKVVEAIAQCMRKRSLPQAQEGVQ